MGASLSQPAVKQQLADLAEQAVQAQRQIQLDLAQGALDAAGIVDPTPISDGLSALLSVARGNWIDAGLSVVSMLPYAGDALGKTAKGSKLMARLAKGRAVIADNAIKARQIIANALKSDTAAIRAQRARLKAERIEEGLVNGCKYNSNRFGTRSPVDGWTSGEKGHGLWDPAKRTGIDKGALEDIEAVTEGKPIRFDEGFPDFSPYTAKLSGADGKLVAGKVEIPMKGETPTSAPQGRRWPTSSGSRTGRSPRATPGITTRMASRWSWSRRRCTTMCRIPVAQAWRAIRATEKVLR